MKTKQVFEEYARSGLGAIDHDGVKEILVDRLLDAEDSQQNRRTHVAQIQQTYEDSYVDMMQREFPEFGVQPQKAVVPNPEVAWLVKLLELDLQLGLMYRNIDLLSLTPKCGRAILPWLMLTDLDYAFLGLGIRAAQLGHTAHHVGLLAEDAEIHFSETQLDVIANYCLHCALNGEQNAIESFAFWKKYLRILHV